jgi:hypothetical protein
VGYRGMGLRPSSASHSPGDLGKSFSHFGSEVYVFFQI